jgi:hypothetical protein
VQALRCLICEDKKKKFHLRQYYLLLEAYEHCNLMRFQVLTVTSMKMTVFWDVAPCSLVETDWMFQRCLLPPLSRWWGWWLTPMMEAVSTSEMSVNFHQITWRSITEDSHLHCYLMFKLQINMQSIQYKANCSKYMNYNVKNTHYK